MSLFLSPLAKFGNVGHRRCLHASLLLASMAPEITSPFIGAALHHIRLGCHLPNPLVVTTLHIGSIESGHDLLHTPDLDMAGLLFAGSNCGRRDPPSYHHRAVISPLGHQNSTRGSSCTAGGRSCTTRGRGAHHSYLAVWEEERGD